MILAAFKASKVAPWIVIHFIEHGRNTWWGSC